MAKIPIKHLVSLIMEQINLKAELNSQFPPDRDVYIDDPNKYPILFEPAEKIEASDAPQDEVPQTDVDPDRGKIRTLEPELEPELDMVAEQGTKPNRGPAFPRTELDEAIRIPVENLMVGEKSDPPGRVVCEDPDTGEMVEGMVISKVVAQLPSNKWMLVFKNHGESEIVDQPKVRTRYVILSDDRTRGEFMKNLPRRKATGNPPDRDVLATLLANPPAEDAPDDVKNEWKEKVETLQNARVKRYILFPLINRMFSEHAVLDKLDVSLIPEAWATPKRTEHTTNVSESRVKSFGGTSDRIDVDFYSVRDMTDVPQAIADVMDLRADLALGGIDIQDGDDRERELSSAVPRRHANIVYRNGNWYAKQRVHDEEFFERAGGETDVYKLLSQNTQKGDKKVTVESVLDVKGQIEGDQYGLVSTFKSTLSVRHPETNHGVTVGDLFDPIVTQMRKPLGNRQAEGFTVEKDITFFVEEGRNHGAKTGFLPDFFEQVGQDIVSSINPDAVLQTMAALAEDAAQVTDEQLNNAGPNQ